MDLISARTILIGAKLTDLFNNNTEALEAIDIAVDAINKQISTKPIMERWNPAKCPLCGESLSEHKGDGYYHHYYHLNMCDCGQKIEWK